MDGCLEPGSHSFTNDDRGSADRRDSTIVSAPAYRSLKSRNSVEPWGGLRSISVLSKLGSIATTLNGTMLRIISIDE
jgi:hypothetical protein